MQSADDELQDGAFGSVADAADAVIEQFPDSSGSFIQLFVFELSQLDLHRQGWVEKSLTLSPWKRPTLLPTYSGT